MADGEDSSDRERVEAATVEVLEGGDVKKLTIKTIRDLVAEKTGIDVSSKEYKKLVSGLVDDHLAKLQSKEQRDSDENEEEEPSAKKRKKFKTGDSGEIVVCELSSRRKVTVGEFKGRLLISIREYYEKNGKEFPSSKAARGQATLNTDWKNQFMFIGAQIALYNVDPELCIPSQGISLSLDQWQMLAEHVGDVDEAIRQSQGQ